MGSLTDPGGRFNIGDIDPQNFSTFSALYIALDKDTALQETQGQVEVPGSSLIPREIALTSAGSITIFSVSGHLDKVFDVRSTKNLKKFVALIKEFKLSKELIDMARKLEEPSPEIVRQPKILHQVLQASNWRNLPMRLDVPSTSQIFGQLVYFAGIEGILYTSKLTGKDCLAVYPDNFGKSDSFIELDDDPPSPKVPTRMNSENFKICHLSFNEL
ncbi:MAG: RES domain-containing protein [Nitrospinae bacterium]|nr:RES domain-containing protein [Nitrospinota bacterium]